MSAIQTANYYDKVYALGQMTYEAISKGYEKASQPGELQMRLYAGTRATIGLASVYFFPYAAGVGILSAMVMPKVTAGAMEGLDSMLTGLWNRMSFEQKMIASSAGIAITWAGYGVVSLPANIFAAKVGAKATIDNLTKEQIAAATREIEKQLAGKLV